MSDKTTGDFSDDNCDGGDDDINYDDNDGGDDAVGDDFCLIWRFLALEIDRFTNCLDPVSPVARTPPVDNEHFSVRRQKKIEI